MAKKVIGILLICFSSLFLFMGITFGVIFGGLGAVFGTVGNREPVLDAAGSVKEAKGEVLSVYEGGSWIWYEVDGEEYLGYVNVTSSSYPKGTHVTVEYDSANPENMQVPEMTEAVFGMLGNIFGGVGIALAVLFGLLGIAGLIGGILLLKSYKKSTLIPQI